MYIDPKFHIAKNSLLWFSVVISFTTMLIHSYLVLLQLLLMVHIANSITIGTPNP